MLSFACKFTTLFFYSKEKSKRFAILIENGLPRSSLNTRGLTIQRLGLDHSGVGA